MRNRLLPLLFFWLSLVWAVDAHALQSYAKNNVVTPPNSDTINNLALSAGVSGSVTWPTGAAYVNINCAAPPYYTSQQSGITVPSGNVTNGTGAALNAAQRQRGSGETVFYIIAAASQECSFEFWGP